MSYRRLYDSVLMDEIHNYFPELLYAPERFRTVVDVLAYVQQQADQRFNLFSRGRREFLESYRNQTVSTPPTRNRGVSMLFEADRGMDTGAAAAATEFINSINMMNGLFQLPIAPTQNNMGGRSAFMDPVIVAPTAEQIQSGTAIEIVDSDDEMCAICQDNLPAGTQSLNLVACDHRFHSACIRTWFTTNVVCPVCRHDIREPAAPL